MVIDIWRQGIKTAGIKVIFVIWWQGVQDGWESPYDLGMGMTYGDLNLNSIYDRGANFGQWLGQRLKKRSV